MCDLKQVVLSLPGVTCSIWIQSYISSPKNKETSALTKDYDCELRKEHILLMVSLVTTTQVYRRGHKTFSEHVYNIAWRNDLTHDTYRWLTQLKGPAVQLRAIIHSKEVYQTKRSLFIRLVVVEHGVVKRKLLNACLVNYKLIEIMFMGRLQLYA